MRKRRIANNNPNLQIITINLTPPAVRALQILQDMGLYPSRSEAIRSALHDFLTTEMGITPTSRKSKVELIKISTDARGKEIAGLLKKLRDESESECKSLP
jgi:Arc/MetJ-type ribon-helix-helix transcriptional regulator